MKMLNKVFAPLDGKVVFHIKEKDIVSKNQLLFEIVE
jgi:biotin carboxyl carrier protein